MKQFISLLVAVATIACAYPIGLMEKRDLMGQGGSPCGQINQVQQPYSAPIQVQAVQPCAPPPVQVQAVQPVQVQAVQPCAPPSVQVQAIQPQPMLQTQIYYQPAPPIPSQLVSYYSAPAYKLDDEDNSGCYSSLGTSFAVAAGKFVRNIACPWSFFVEQIQNSGGDSQQLVASTFYPPPPPQAPQPVYIPQAQPQQPGQYFTTVVPVVPSQGTQNQALQPVHASLVPDYGLPNGYGAAIC